MLAFVDVACCSFLLLNQFGAVIYIIYTSVEKIIICFFHCFIFFN